MHLKALLGPGPSQLLDFELLTTRFVRETSLFSATNFAVTYCNSFGKPTQPSKLELPQLQDEDDDEDHDDDDDDDDEDNVVVMMVRRHRAVVP